MEYQQQWTEIIQNLSKILSENRGRKNLHFYNPQIAHKGVRVETDQEKLLIYQQAVKKCQVKIIKATTDNLKLTSYFLTPTFLMISGIP